MRRSFISKCHRMLANRRWCRNYLRYEILVHFVDRRSGVDRLKLPVDSINRFLFGRDRDLSQHGSCHLAEKVLDGV